MDEERKISPTRDQRCGSQLIILSSVLLSCQANIRSGSISNLVPAIGASDDFEYREVPDASVG